MGLRTKFNLLLLFVALVGMALFFVASTPILDGVARDEVIHSSRIMMEAAAGARKYTSEEIAPLLAGDMGKDFHAQTVSAYAAKKSFGGIHAKFADYTYREAALNPTNLEDKASDWEADIINDFRAHPDKLEIIVRRKTPVGSQIELARPLVANQRCLSCHSTPDAAPKSMVALYGRENGFGWKPGEIVGAQIVSVPMKVANERAGKVRNLFLLTYTGIFILLFALLNLLLGATVIGPIDRMARTAEAVSMGEADAPEFEWKGSDQIARLAGSFNRMRRSLHEALRMLGDH